MSSIRSRGGRAKPEEKPKRGLSAIPRWLHKDLGLSDWLAGSIVVLVGGFLLVALFYVLILVWPAG